MARRERGCGSQEAARVESRAAEFRQKNTDFKKVEDLRRVDTFTFRDMSVR
jgi:hypothetical protein